MSATFVLHPGNVGGGKKTGYGFDDSEPVKQITEEILRLPVSNFMPDRGLEFSKAAYVAIPAVGTSAIVVQFKVPEGQNGMINLFSNVFVGGGFTEGQGGVFWTLFQDLTQNVVAADFNNIVASLGSVNNPSKLNGIRIKENQLVTLLVTNVSIVVAGQLIGGRLGGYFYPIDLEPPTSF